MSDLEVDAFAFEDNIAYHVIIGIILILTLIETIFGKGLLIIHFIAILFEKGTNWMKRTLCTICIFFVIVIQALHLLPSILACYPAYRLQILGGHSDDYANVVVVLFALNAFLSLVPAAIGFIFRGRRQARDYQVAEKTIDDDYTESTQSNTGIAIDQVSKPPKQNGAGNTDSMTSSTFDMSASSSDIGMSLQSGELPMVFIVMPIYNEMPDVLVRAVVSTLESNYPKDKFHLFLAFDEDEVTTAYVKTAHRLGVYLTPANLDYPEYIHTDYYGVRMSLCRFPHGGKKSAQENSIEIIRGLYMKEPFYWQSLLAFIDSDIVLDENAIMNFVKAMKKGKHISMTGLITIRTSENYSNFLWLLQESEYFYSQMYSRHFESFVGSVTCLPGALTIMTISAFEDIQKEYFNTRDAKFQSLLHYHMFSLGEDRHLTQLLLQRYCGVVSHTLSFCPRARCKTEGPSTWRSYLKQRRRWLLGTVPNDAAMLSSPTLWRRMPVLMMLHLLTVSRSIGIMVYPLMVLVPLQTDAPFTAVLVLLSPFLLLWIFMIIDSISIRRYKMSAFFPILYFLQPALTWIITIYAIKTIRRRTWGGPRTKEGAEANANPQGYMQSREFDEVTKKGDRASVRWEISAAEEEKPAISYRSSPRASRPRSVFVSKVSCDVNTSRESNGSWVSHQEIRSDRLDLRKAIHKNQPLHHRIGTNRMQHGRSHDDLTSFAAGPFTETDSSDQSSKPSIVSGTSSNITRPPKIPTAVQFRSTDQSRNADMFLSVYQKYADNDDLDR